MVEIKTPVSRWKQVAEYLKERIFDGTFPAGQPLSSEQQLAEEFGLSRPTIRNAINELKTAGLVEVKRPLGTFVRSTHARPACSDDRGLVQSPEGYSDKCDLTWQDLDTPSVVRQNATVTHADYLGIPTGEPMLVRSVMQSCGDTRRLHRILLPFSVAAETPWADDASLPDAHALGRHSPSRSRNPASAHHQNYSEQRSSLAHGGVHSAR
ncbi:GntR family transcriptional regulator [Nonomuraea sp. NPDC049480]|uniref:GntR family transcriptional regulator n=1 Tax=Nonomuraea sp. NPDC049480 TaxID=3364353 RepID=UPI00379BA1C9